MFSLWTNQRLLHRFSESPMQLFSSAQEAVLLSWDDDVGYEKTRLDVVDPFPSLALYVSSLPRLVGFPIPSFCC